MKYNYYIVEKLEGGAWKCVCCEKTFSKSTKKSKHQNTETHELKLYLYKKEKFKKIEAEKEEE